VVKKCTSLSRLEGTSSTKSLQGMRGNSTLCHGTIATYSLSLQIFRGQNTRICGGANMIKTSSTSSLHSMNVRFLTKDSLPIPVTEMKSTCCLSDFRTLIWSSKKIKLLVPGLLFTLKIQIFKGEMKVPRSDTARTVVWLMRQQQ
jgi:hypothetical protein